MTTYLTIPPTGESPYWGDSVATSTDLPIIGNTTGEIVFVQDSSRFYKWTGSAWVDASGEVSGPASSTTNGIARFSDTTGKIIKDSSATIADSGEITSASLTASRALVSGSSKEIQTSSVTTTELGYVSGVTSAIQTQLGTKVTGPASAVDNTIARYDSTTGKLIQGSGVTIDDSDNVATTARINAGTGVVGGSGSASSGATLEVKGTSGAFLLPRLTTTQRDALTATNGCCIYNSSTDRPQCYVAGSWVDLIGWGS